LRHCENWAFQPFVPASEWGRCYFFFVFKHFYLGF
jgi:hypothetical protein